MFSGPGPACVGRMAKEHGPKYSFGLKPGKSINKASPGLLLTQFKISQHVLEQMVHQNTLYIQEQERVVDLLLLVQVFNRFHIFFKFTCNTFYT